VLTDAEELGIVRPQTALKDKLINLRLRLKEGIATSALVKHELRAILPLLESVSSESKENKEFWRFGPFKQKSSTQMPDGTQAQPFHFVQVGSKLTSIVNLIWLIVLIAIVYSVVSSARNGSGGEAGLLGIGREEPTQVQNPTTTFKDVIGDEEAKEDLLEIVQFLTNPTKFTDMKARLPRGVLLTGPPGCGKTLLARALAGEAGVPFLVASGAEFEEMFVGVGAKRVRKLFKRAKELAPCVVFIDEIDVIGGDRDAAEFRRTRMTLQQLLVEMDGFDQNTGIVVVAATNFPDILDPALTRSGRFDRKVAVRLPDLTSRRGILKLYLGDDYTEEPQIDRLAKSSAGFSGADLSNLVNAARVEAARRGSKVLDFDLLAWARDMVSMGRERKYKSRSEWELQLVAYVFATLLSLGG
jgi:ATP-dependent metalloprotease